MKLPAILAAAALGLLPLQMTTGAMAADPREPKMAAGDFRALDPQNALVIDTEKGRIVVEMYPEIAPQSVARVKELARAKFYDGLTFHRVVDDFMAQGGDPKGDGSGGSDRPNVPAEFSTKRGADTPFLLLTTAPGREDGLLKAMPVRSQSSDLMALMADGRVAAWGVWCPGVAGMARANEPDSANSQFFLMRQYSDQLERKYTPWGRVVVGLEVVRNLAVGVPAPHPDHMLTVRVLADLPAGQQPKVSVLDTGSASFKALVDYDKTLHPGFGVCDVDLPSKVQ